MAANITWDTSTFVGQLTMPVNLDGVAFLDVQGDVWSDTMDDWSQDNAAGIDFRKHTFPLEYAGGFIDPVTGDQQGALYLLRAPWKLQLVDQTHELRVGGVLRTDDGSRFWLPPATASGYAVIADPPNDVVALLSEDADNATIQLIEKILRNRRETNPTTGKQTVYDDDSTTVLIEGDLYEDVAGTQPYQGQGADRADRME